MRSFAHIALCLLAASCTFDTSAPVTGDTARADASPDQADADILGQYADLSDKQHLLLSEIKTTGSGKEYIEIYNPGELAVDLSNYYIGDTAEYAKVPGAFGNGPVPSVNNSDFIARFPAGASIAPGAAITMAVRPTAWEEQFGVLPDYRIGGEPTGALMREAFGLRIGNLTTLTDSGEGIALFRWDGASDTVVDIDLADVGPATTEVNRLTDKSGLQIDGPDSETEASAYATDLNTMTNIGIDLQFGESYHRLEPEDGHEARNVRSNGDHGHDETSEDIASSWGVEVASPGEAAPGL